MVSSSKILTVSYGTFSCTAEGFDDPLAVVKETTHFFRGVVSDDRFFGAEPPQFDPEMATEMMRDRLGAPEGGTLTVGKGFAPATAASAGAMTAALAAGRPRAATEATAEAPALPDDDTIEATAVLTDAAEAPEQSDALAQAVTQAVALGNAGGDVADAMPEAAQDDLSDLADVPETAAPADTADMAAPEAEPAPAPQADTISAKLDRIRAVVSSQESEPEAEEDDAPVFESQGETVDDTALDALLVELQGDDADAATDTDAADALESSQTEDALGPDAGSSDDGEAGENIFADSIASLLAEEEAATIDGEAEDVTGEAPQSAETDAGEDSPAPAARTAMLGGAAAATAALASAFAARSQPSESAPQTATAPETDADEDSDRMVFADLPDVPEMTRTEDRQAEGEAAIDAALDAGMGSEPEAALDDAPETRVPAPETALDDAPEATVAEPASDFDNAPEATVAELEADFDDAPEAPVAALETAFEDAPETAVTQPEAASDEASEATVAEPEAALHEAPVATQPEPETADSAADEAKVAAADAKAASPFDDAPPAAPLRARVVKVKRATFDRAIRNGQIEEVAAEQKAPEVPAVPLAADSTLSPEEEDELSRELAAVKAELSQDFDAWGRDAEDEEDEAMAPPPLRLDNPVAAPEEATAQQDDEDTAPTGALEERIRSVARKTVKMASPARAMLTEREVGDGDTSRLMEQTDDAMEEPEGNRRRSAIAHLRAAVAATKADKLLGRKSDVVDEQELYREDLASVVRPRRPQPSSAARSERPAEPAAARPAPLKLVAEQRVAQEASGQSPAQAAQPPAASEEGSLPRTVQVRPRRVRRIAEAPVSPGADGEGFAEFADSVGAESLPELLEAAAAYMSYVEGRDQFSRPQLMSTVRQAEEAESSREDRLRSFGQLLREGKIKKTAGGRFTASERIGFKPEKAAG